MTVPKVSASSLTSSFSSSSNSGSFSISSNLNIRLSTTTLLNRFSPGFGAPPIGSPSRSDSSSECHVSLLLSALADGLSGLRGDMGETHSCIFFILFDIFCFSSAVGGFLFFSSGLPSPFSFFSLITSPSPPSPDPPTAAVFASLLLCDLS